MEARVALLSKEDAPTEMRRELEKLEVRFGELPVCVRAAANSPRALDGLLSLAGALGWGRINEELADRIAIVVAVANDCAHLEEAHRCALRRHAAVTDEEIERAREARSGVPRYDAALKFARALVDGRGRVDDEAFEAVRSAGFSDEEIVEIVSHVALQTFGNYLDLALMPTRQ